jgi:hypothetical protein
MRLTLFDSQLDKLKLPVLRAPTLSVFGGEESSNETSRAESVAFQVHKYFEWVGTFNRCMICSFALSLVYLAEILRS